MVKKSRSDADRRVRQCERLGRLLRLLHLINGKGRWDADALAEEFGCSRRTIHRMFQTLSMAGVPWHFDNTVGAYRVRPGFRFPVPHATSESPRNGTASDRLKEATRQTLQSGEAFVQALREFQAALEVESDR